MFSWPPMNHLANGSFHSSTRSQGLNQCSSRAILAQKPSGSSLASLYSRSYSARLLIWAPARNSSGGSKTRRSLRTESMAFDDMALHSISPNERAPVDAMLNNTYGGFLWDRSSFRSTAPSEHVRPVLKEEAAPDF